MGISENAFTIRISRNVEITPPGVGYISGALRTIDFPLELTQSALRLDVVFRFFLTLRVVCARSITGYSVETIGDRYGVPVTNDASTSLALGSFLV